MREAPLVLRVADVRPLLNRTPGASRHALVTWPDRRAVDGSAVPGAQIRVAASPVALDGSRTLTLAYHAPFRGVTQRVEDRVEAHAVPMRFGGVRWWLCCRRCGRRRAALYFATTVPVFRCRTCLALAYPSQRLAPLARIQRRARTIARRRLGQRGDDALEADGPRRPKGMRRATFERWCAALDALRAQGAALAVRRVAGRER